MIKGFLIKHGNGFWLHALGALAIMLVGWWSGYADAALLLNSLLWPVREMWQKRKDPERFFTPHVLLEWVPAIVIGFILYGILV